MYKGADHPLVSSTGFEDGFFNSDGLGGATNSLDDIDIEIENEHAVLAMIRLAKKYPKQITLITLGPMTNLALANQIDQTFFDNVARIVSMGGLLDSLGNVTPVTEFNFYNDPDSVHVVLTKSKCDLTLVPWDTAFSHRIPWVQLSRLLPLLFIENLFQKKYDELVKMNTSTSEFIGKIYGWYRCDPLYGTLNILMQLKYISIHLCIALRIVLIHSGERHFDGLIMCDILCVISAIFPDLIVTSHEYPVAMELSGQLTRGQLIVGRTALIFPFSGSRVINFVQKINMNDVINLIFNMSVN